MIHPNNKVHNELSNYSGQRSLEQRQLSISNHSLFEKELHSKGTSQIINPQNTPQHYHKDQLVSAHCSPSNHHIPSLTGASREDDCLTNLAPSQSFPLHCSVERMGTSYFHSLPSTIPPYCVEDSPMAINVQNFHSLSPPFKHANDSDTRVQEILKKKTFLNDDHPLIPSPPPPTCYDSDKSDAENNYSPSSVYQRINYTTEAGEASPLVKQSITDDGVLHSTEEHAPLHLPIAHTKGVVEDFFLPSFSIHSSDVHDQACSQFSHTPPPYSCITNSDSTNQKAESSVSNPLMRQLTNITRPPSSDGFLLAFDLEKFEKLYLAEVPLKSSSNNPKSIYTNLVSKEQTTKLQAYKNSLEPAPSSSLNSHSATDAHDGICKSNPGLKERVPPSPVLASVQGDYCEPDPYYNDRLPQYSPIRATIPTQRQSEYKEEYIRPISSYPGTTLCPISSGDNKPVNPKREAAGKTEVINRFNTPCKQRESRVRTRKGGRSQVTIVDASNLNTIRHQYLSKKGSAQGQKSPFVPPSLQMHSPSHHVAAVNVNKESSRRNNFKKTMVAHSRSVVRLNRASIFRIASQVRFKNEKQQELQKGSTGGECNRSKGREKSLRDESRARQRCNYVQSSSSTGSMRSHSCRIVF